MMYVLFANEVPVRIGEYLLLFVEVCVLRVANVRLDLDDVHIKLQGGTSRRRRRLNLKQMGTRIRWNGGRRHDRPTMLRVIIPACIPPRAAPMYGSR